LLVEDDFNLGFVIQDNLKQHGYMVNIARDGKEGLQLFNEKDFDICLLDVMLPKKDGFSLAEDIRKTNTSIPILFLTAKSLIDDKVTGYKAGGDDYLVKPFEMQELFLRIEALLKRTGKGSKEGINDNLFTIGAFKFDYDNFVLEYDSEQKKLTKKEAAILKLLCQHKNKLLQRELVLNMVWGDDSYFTGRSLDVFIAKLRKYLKADDSIRITNVHGIGFKLEEDENTNPSHL